MIAAHAVFGFEMANDRLDGGTSFHLAFDLRGDAALLASGVDLELVFWRRVVATVSGISAAYNHDRSGTPAKKAINRSDYEGALLNSKSAISCSIFIDSASRCSLSKWMTVPVDMGSIARI